MLGVYVDYKATHRFLDIMMRPDMNIPEVLRASEGREIS